MHCEDCKCTPLLFEGTVVLLVHHDDRTSKMSPILFTLYLETLCQMALASKVISGLTMESERLCVLAYADNVAFICSQGSQVGEIITLENQFCHFSGAVLRGAWLGEWASNPTTYLE